MMTYAYDEKYLLDATTNLGEAFDYAVNACHVDIDIFMQLFIATGYSKKFENGDPKTISGLSGTELAMEVLSKSGERYMFPGAQIEFSYSEEYWCGYIISYYQFKSGKDFKEIHRFITMHDILKLYPTLHESSEEKFVDTINSIISKQNIPTKLQTQRKICGLTQKELSIKSGVNLRTLQQYETRAKDLKNAAISTVISLANNLGCEVKNII